MNQLLIAISILISFGCNNSKDEILNSKPVEIKYKCSFYKNNNDTIQFVRLVNDSSELRRIEGEISYNSNYNTIQTITHIEIIQADMIQDTEVELMKMGYRNKFDNKLNVMFIQLRPNDLKDMEILDLRHKMENKIERILSKNRIGEWVAGDLGPGGANMLFEVTDWDKSFQLVINLLNTKV